MVEMQTLRETLVDVQSECTSLSSRLREEQGAKEMLCGEKDLLVQQFATLKEQLEAVLSKNKEMGDRLNELHTQLENKDEEMGNLQVRFIS